MRSPSNLRRAKIARGKVFRMGRRQHEMLQGKGVVREKPVRRRLLAMMGPCRHCCNQNGQGGGAGRAPLCTAQA